MSTIAAIKKYFWEPRKILCQGAITPQALIILNTPILNVDLFASHWQSSPLRIAADGGANTLKELDLIPHSVVGKYRKYE